MLQTHQVLFWLCLFDLVSKINPELKNKKKAKKKRSRINAWNFLIASCKTKIDVNHLKKMKKLGKLKWINQKVKQITLPHFVISLIMIISIRICCRKKCYFFQYNYATLVSYVKAFLPKQLVFSAIPCWLKTFGICAKHYVKSVQRRSFFSFEYRKIRTRKTSVFGYFSRSGGLLD